MILRVNLINARKQKQLTQVQVAKILGISETYYQNIEYATRQGSIKIWDELEDLFGIPQRQLRDTKQMLDGNLAKNDTSKE